MIERCQQVQVVILPTATTTTTTTAAAAAEDLCTRVFQLYYCVVVDVE